MAVLDAMNRVLTPDAVMWWAAAASLVLLLAVSPVRSVVTGGRRDAGFRALRTVLVLVILLTAGLPLLLLLSGEAVSGVPCGCFLLFFPLFCYYFGKGAGVEKGRGGLADLVGLDGSGDIEDAQDRLYESRLRLPSRDAVAASIAVLTRSARDGSAAGGEDEDAIGGEDAIPGPKSSLAAGDAILDVDVEEV